MSVRCFPVNFAKFSRAPFSWNTSGRLLLCRVIQVMKDEGFVNKLYYITILILTLTFLDLINFLTFLN